MFQQDNQYCREIMPYKDFMDKLNVNYKNIIKLNLYFLNHIIKHSNKTEILLLSKVISLIEKFILNNYSIKGYEYELREIYEKLGEKLYEVKVSYDVYKNHTLFFTFYKTINLIFNYDDNNEYYFHCLRNNLYHNINNFHDININLILTKLEEILLLGKILYNDEMYLEFSKLSTKEKILNCIHEIQYTSLIFSNSKIDSYPLYKNMIPYNHNGLCLAFQKNCYFPNTTKKNNLYYIDENLNLIKNNEILFENKEKSFNIVWYLMQIILIKENANTSHSIDSVIGWCKLNSLSLKIVKLIQYLLQ